MSFTQALQTNLASCLGDLAAKISPAQWETLALLTHFEQASTLFASLEDERQGAMVSFDSAFEDL